MARMDSVPNQEPLTNRTALVLYGSETGNAQDVAEDLARLTRRLRFATRLTNLDSVDLRQLIQYDVVLISISTTGQGELPANAQTLWKSLRSMRLRPGCLEPLLFASFGLGDSSYPKFNWAHRKLHNRLVQLGAQPIIERGEADEQHSEGLDGTYQPWLQKLRDCILEEFPLPDGIEAIPAETMLEPQWVLEFVPEEELRTNPKQNLEMIQSGSNVPDEPPPELLPIENSFTATVVNNERVTKKDHFQDTRLLTVTTPRHVSYGPGDAIAIHPKNFQPDVSDFLRGFGWTAIADKPLRYVPTCSGAHSPLEQSKSLLSSIDHPITLRWLATNFLDIMSVPKRSFFAWMREFASDPDEKVRLGDFISTDPEDLQDLWDYTTRVKRSIVEVLGDFNSLKVPWQWIIDIVPTMRSRLFSIASGGKLKYIFDPRDGHITGTNFELLIAIVRYQTLIRRPREGVCTKYIASLSAGARLNIVRQRGGLHFSPSQVQQPVLMIAPGTGVAPMRSLICERHHVRTQLAKMQTAGAVIPATTSDMLFFGCRSKDADFYFSDEWPRFTTPATSSTPKPTTTEDSPSLYLILIPAFSRDMSPDAPPAPKRYVQHLIADHADEVVNLLVKHEGMVYVCGSSGKMPQAVRAALIQSLVSAGGMSEAGAGGYLEGMEKAGRYRQETW